MAGQELASAKEQVLNVVNFVALSLEAKQLSSKVDAARAAGNETVDTALSELVRALLDISTVSVPAYSASDKADLATSTNYGLQAAVRLMSTQAFSEAILWLLDLADDGIQSSALALLRTRLPAIKPTRRGDISPAVVNVVERIRVVMLDSKVDSDGALETLDVIAESVWAEEDLVLAKTVPDLIAVAGATGAAKSTRMLAMSIVKKLSCVPFWSRWQVRFADEPRRNRLGPRLIPLVAKITPFAVQVLRQEAQSAYSSLSPLTNNPLTHATLPSSSLDHSRNRQHRVRDPRRPLHLDPYLHRRPARQGLRGSSFVRHPLAHRGQGQRGGQGTSSAPVDGGKEAAGQDAVPCDHSSARFARRHCGRGAFFPLLWKAGAGS